jgi:hypothetical protein
MCFDIRNDNITNVPVHVFCALNPEKTDLCTRPGLQCLLLQKKYYYWRAYCRYVSIV